jgi:hypothetical protein
LVKIAVNIRRCKEIGMEIRSEVMGMNESELYTESVTHTHTHTDIE